MSLNNLKMCAALAPAILLVGFGGGCASPVPSREPFAAASAATIEPPQGSSWESVLPSPEVARWHEFIDPRNMESYGRADHRLAAASGSDVNAMNWPAAARPSLAQTRRLDIRDRDGRIVYFDRERWREQRWRWYDGSRR